MSKDTPVKDKNLITYTGKVVEVLPNANFRVKIDNTDHVVLAYTTGKMRKKRIRVMVDDIVTVEISTYDMTKGRIVYRQK